MESIGYQFLIQYFSLNVIPPYKCSYLTSRSVRTKEIFPDGENEFLPQKFKTDGSWQEHLLFALKNEGINPQILNALFKKLDKNELLVLIQQKIHSIYSRRIWFFYEFLMKEELPIPPIKTGNYDFALPQNEYFVLDEAHSVRAKRQRLWNNLPGNADFCPIVRITKKIKAKLNVNYENQIYDALKKYPAELIYRANSFLYLKETKSSYAIERQTPTQKRIATFMAILQQAGKNTLTKDFLLKLQNAVVEERYIENDYRNDQVYVGQTLAPGRELIHFVGAKPEDVAGFMQAWFEMAHRLLESNGNPVIMASIISFAFVFIHPFNDGNGRIHRYLLHHVLTAKKFNPDNIIFPVSAVLYKQPGLYDEMLESFSRKLMEKVDYVLADDGSMTVTNETGDFYRFINFTKIVEDFFDVVEETLKTELIPELDYLIAWERARIKMRDVVDMPEKKALQFIMFTQQNNGKFPKSRRKNFEELSETEIEKLAAIVEQEIISRNSKN